MNFRKAIITGSISYKESPLSYPNKDIDAFSLTLEKRCRFNPEDINKILVKPNDTIDFISKIKEICSIWDKEKSNSYELLLFYYSGHGVYRQEAKTSYLQVTDDEFVSIEDIIDVISSVKSKNKYFIIDACQSGGFSLMQPKGKLHRQYAYNSEGIYCMFGTTKNLLAFEPSMASVIKKKINNSYYTHFIIEALETKTNYIDNTISIRLVDDYASRKTPTYTNFEQIPFSTTEVTGFFPFGFWEEETQLDDISLWNNSRNSNTHYSFDQEVYIVEYIKEKIQKLFTEKDYYLFSADRDMLGKLSQPAKDLLNESLTLDRKKINQKPLINGLISSDNLKEQFILTFLLETEQIKIDLSLKDHNGITALQEAIMKISDNSTYIIQLLFKRGYYVSDEELSFLNSEFNKSGIRSEIFSNFVMAIICYRLMDNDKISRLRRIERIVLSILSYKIGTVVGYRINHVGLANNFLQHHKEFASLFLKALKTYGYYEELSKKESFQKKEKSIKEDIPFQENKYDDIFQVLLPDLFQ